MAGTACTRGHALCCLLVQRRTAYTKAVQVCQAVMLEMELVTGVYTVRRGAAWRSWTVVQAHRHGPRSNHRVAHMHVVHEPLGTGVHAVLQRLPPPARYASEKRILPPCPQVFRMYQLQKQQFYLFEYVLNNRARAAREAAAAAPQQAR